MSARVALVTGGTRGLGAAIARMLGSGGYKVASVYHGNDAAATAFREQTGIPVFKWDIAVFDACKAGIAQVEAELGPIDVLVNNGGITRDATLHHMDPSQWRDVIATNLDSLFNMCRNVIEGMRARHYGRIVNISSVNGQKGQIGQTNYSASKAGILGFTRALALENATHGITVNAIAPGYCATDMVAAVKPEVMKSILATIPVGRLARPEDIARLVDFLAREDSDYITGATYSINGGQYLA
jgi:acetoacetyl-CoA reductase